MNRERKNILILLGVGWLVGAASGVTMMRLGRHLMHRGHTLYMRNRLVRELDLSPEQKAQMDSVLAKNRETLNQIFAQTRPKIEEVRDTTQSDVRRLLTPAQQIKFDQMATQLNQHFDHHFLRFPGKSNR